MLNWPATGAHLARLELRDAKGRLLSENVYWHARDEHELQQLDSLPKVSLKGRLHVHSSGTGTVVEGQVINPSQTPALLVRLTLRDAKTGRRILPAYYDDNYFSIMPGEGRDFRIETRDPVKEAMVDITGWNIESISLLKAGSKRGDQSP